MRLRMAETTCFRPPRTLAGLLLVLYLLRKLPMSSENTPPHLEDLGRHGEKQRDGDGTQAQHTEGLPSSVLPSTPWARYHGESPRVEIGGPESDPRGVSWYHRPDSIVRSQPLSGFIPAQPQSHRGGHIPPVIPIPRSPPSRPRRDTEEQEYPPFSPPRHSSRSRHEYLEPGYTLPTRRAESRSRYEAPRRSRSYTRPAYHSAPLPYSMDAQASSSYGHGGYMPHIHAPMSEPPYVTVNPFSVKPHRKQTTASYYASASPASSVSHPSAPSPRSSSGHYPQYDPSLTPPVLSPPRRRPTWGERIKRHLLVRILHSFLIFLLFRIPQQIYLHLLLRLPLLYFSRVSRLFEDANLSLPDIRRMAVANADQWKDGTPGAFKTTLFPNDEVVLPNLLNFRHSWEGFIDSLLREWKTQNVVSALMLSAILTMLQIDAAAADPIARTTALLSLICALMSLLFGSMYIIRFGTMRKMYKAASWADEAQKGALADPVNTALSNHTAHGLRIGVSAVLAVALIYVFLIVKTFRKYGDVMDQKWNEKVMGWAREGRYAQIAETAPILASSRTYLYPSRRMSPMRSTSPPERGRSFTREVPPVQPTPAPSFQRRFVPPANRDLAPFAAVKASWTHPLPTLLAERDILLADWVRFTQDLSAVWDGTVLSSTPPFPIDPDSPIGLRERAAGVIHLWNGEFFLARSTEAVLCKEKPCFGLPSYAVYLLHLSPDTPFGPLLEGMHSVTVIHLIEPADRGPATVQYDVVAAAQTPIRGNLPITAQSESEPAHEPEPGASGRASQSSAPERRTDRPSLDVQHGPGIQNTPPGSAQWLTIPLPPSPAPSQGVFTLKIFHTGSEKCNKALQALPTY
ncbi:hypothetical protein C8R43DRAFT_943413 [Mycena crocata]|nr:hypothetical protein C8R43DRAFT_943413 [Mycena crocata]